MKKFAFLGGSGAGKSTLVACLQRDPELAHLKIADIDDFLPYEEMKGETNETLPRSWDRYERIAAERAVVAGVDVLFGVMSGQIVRDYVEEQGYAMYVLALAEDVQRERILRRERETGKQVNLEASLAGGRWLQTLSYPKIRADQPVDVVASVIRAVLLERS